MNDDKKICPTCHGNGYIMDSDGEQSAAIDCPTCDSQGELNTQGKYYDPSHKGSH